MTGAERDAGRDADGASGAVSATRRRDLVEELHELALLRDLDVLTQAEYRRAKEKVVESRCHAGAQQP